MTRGSDGSSSTFSRSFLMNTVMLDVSPTNSFPQGGFHQLLLRKHEAGIAGQRVEDLELLGREGEARIALGDAEPAHVEREAADVEHLVGGGRTHGRPYERA